MNRQAHEQARRAAEAREDAEMGVGGQSLADVIGAALRAFGKPLAARLDRMDERNAELKRHIDDELGRAVKDVRELNGDLNRQAERIAARAAERAVVRLSNEVEELRREVEALRAEKSNLRAVK